MIMAIIGLVTYIAWQKPALHSKLMLNPYSVVQNKQYYRLLTSGFVHNNSMHLFLNLLTLYFFGQAIEQIFDLAFRGAGVLLYIVFFITAIVVANIPTTLKYREQPHYNSLGASGGVSAMVLAFVIQSLVALLIFVFRHQILALSGATGETAALAVAVTVTIVPAASVPEFTSTERLTSGVPPPASVTTTVPAVLGSPICDGETSSDVVLFEVQFDGV